MGGHRASIVRALTGYMPARALGVAAELRIPDHLAAGPLALDDLARRTGTDPGALGRLLRALAGLDVVAPVDDGWALGEAGPLLADRPGSLRGFAISHTTEMLRAWVDLDQAVATGRAAFDDIYGASYFTWSRAQPESSALFDQAMAALIPYAAIPLLGLDWSEVGTVLDVAGGTGSLLAMVLAGAPHLKGVLFDQPHVVPGADAVLDAAGVRDRVEVVAGDMFDAIPTGADTYVMAQVLHDWDDADCVRILERVRAAMGPASHLLVLELVLQDDGGDHLANWVDLHMLTVLGGQERTEPQWRALLHRAGFHLDSITPGPRSSVIAATPS